MNGRLLVGLAVLTSTAALSMLAASCKHHTDDDAGDPGDAGPLVCAPTPPGTTVAGPCAITVELPPIQAFASRHAPEGTPLTYCTNPPSSGTHYPIWAQFQEYDHPIAEPYLVHDLEHGAVILYWKCDQPDGSTTPCTAPPDVLTALRKVRDDTPTDPLCTATNSTAHVRIIIIPSTTIETPIAAAAWGATYHAACADVPSLDAFVHDHYGKGPELLCVDGEVF